eukprot:GFUD01034310.1.p1 GENE.GFUD01034310.1~~GFUD01034310.1.p1  ORF type:complete len:666 (+),score=304.77 GFUD01034310.1:38-2035(+)
MEEVHTILEDSSKKVNAVVKKTEKFLNQEDEVFEKTKLLTKVVYDVTKLIEVESSKLTMPELIIDNFDCEQVWAGVQMQNQQKFDKFETKFMLVNPAELSNFSLLLGKPKRKEAKEEEEAFEDDVDTVLEEDIELDKIVNSEKDDEVNEEEEDKKELEGNSDEEDDDILNDPDFQNMSDSDGDDLPLFANLSDDELDEEGEGTFKERERSGGGRKTEVDDQFFKMSDMERFLDVEDRKEMEKGKKEESEDEDAIDMFDEIPDNEDQIMYKQYFDKDAIKDGDQDEDIEDEDESEDGEEGDDTMAADSSIPKQKSSHKLLPSSDEEDDGPVKSNHEVAQERLAKKISRLEENAVGAKPWQMGGEVAAPMRQENSLLAEHLEYDTAARHAPVVTEDVARRLEDIIRQRVKDKAWDDVERKVRPVEDPAEYKKKLVLDQEKSKLSLAQVYEEEFMKLAENATAKTPTIGLLDKEEEEETPTEVEEIKDMMSSLFRKLDSLTHMHYTPKQKSAELKIVRNIPSIAMEEVAPTSASNAALLAPAEVVDKKKGELMEDNEKTKTDKKRERREKKSIKRSQIRQREQREALVAKMNPGLGNKYSKGKAMKELELAEKQGKAVVIKNKEKDKTVKTSKAFFTSLQEEVKTHGKEKAAAKKKKKNIVKIASLKL